MPCLDTTALIDLASSRRNPRRVRAEEMLLVHLRAGERVTTTRVNDAEVRVGIYRAVDAADERERVERALEPLEILELNDAAADRFAQIKAHLIATGRPVGDADLLIAAIALTHG